MIPISFGGSSPGQGEREEHGDHHGPGGEDHAAGVGQADHRLARRGCGLVGLRV
jgi:hypothetical protein